MALRLSAGHHSMSCKGYSSQVPRSRRRWACIEYKPSRTLNVLIRVSICCAAGEGPFPEGAKKPGDHLRKVFYRMGLDDQDIVALSGEEPHMQPMLCFHVLSHLSGFQRYTSSYSDFVATYEKARLG